MRTQLPETFDWYIIESSPPCTSSSQDPVRIGPFATEDECRAVLEGVKTIQRFDHGHLEVERRRILYRRDDRRFKSQRPVCVIDAGDTHHFQMAHTIDVSISGVRLGGLREKLRVGSVYNLRCDGRDAPFQVVWVGCQSISSQAGLECLAPDVNIWRLDLSQQPDEERLLREIARARNVQNRLFPQATLPLRTLDYCGHCVQARTVGGDYYDYLPVSEEEVALVVADVSGKGIAASLLMANFHGGLHAHTGSAAGDLGRLLASVNRQIYLHTDADRYISVFIAVYNDATRAMRYMNCGHGPALWLPATGKEQWLEPTATVIGMFPEWHGGEAQVELAAGDILAIYSDGITETCGETGEEFGPDELARTLSANRSGTAAELLQVVESAVEQFRVGEQLDDATLVIARCR